MALVLNSTEMTSVVLDGRVVVVVVVVASWTQVAGVVPDTLTCDTLARLVVLRLQTKPEDPEGRQPYCSGRCRQ